MVPQAKLPVPGVDLRIGNRILQSQNRKMFIPAKPDFDPPGRFGQKAFYCRRIHFLEIVPVQIIPFQRIRLSRKISLRGLPGAEAYIQAENIQVEFVSSAQLISQQIQNVKEEKMGAEEGEGGLVNREASPVAGDFWALGIIGRVSKGGMPRRRSSFSRSNSRMPSGWASRISFIGPSKRGMCSLMGTV
jgi:hypothetical protein